MKNILKFETLKDLIEEHMTFAKKMFADVGRYSPMVIGYTGNTRVIMSIPFENDSQKEQALKMVTMLFIAKGVKRYTIANEGYLLQTEDQNEYTKLQKEGKRISDHPDSIEVLQTIAVSEIETRMIIYKVNKDKTLELYNDSLEKIGGIFSELLPPKNLSQETVDKAKYVMSQMEQFIKEIPLDEEH